MTPDQLDSGKYAEAATVGMKIIGAVLAVVTFRWVAKIFAGPDGKFSVTEFGRFFGFLFFAWWGSYMLWVEGHREHEYPIYSELYIAIVFGSLLCVLHLENSLNLILKIVEAMKGRSSSSSSSSQSESHSN